QSGARLLPTAEAGGFRRDDFDERNQALIIATDSADCETIPDFFKDSCGGHGWGAWVGAWGQTEFQVNLKLGLTPRYGPLAMEERTGPSTLWNLGKVDGPQRLLEPHAAGP